MSATFPTYLLLTILPKLLRLLLLSRTCFAPAKRGAITMSDFPPIASDHQIRPLPNIQPTRPSLHSPSSVFSGTTSSTASSSSLSSASEGSYSLSTGPSPAALCPGYAALVSLSPRTQLTRVACETCRRRKTKVKSLMQVCHAVLTISVLGR